MARTNRFRDITGERFGSYVILSHAGNQLWNARCDCGIEKTVNSANLFLGKCLMCRDCCNKAKIIDLEGQRFGKWTVIKLDKPKFWLCRCDCGNESVCAVSNLRSGNSNQCVKCRLDAIHKPKHGHCQNVLSKTPTYQSWASVKSRCNGRNTTCSRHYGDKGIRMCKGWQDSFSLFLELMGERKSQRLSIDRANTSESTRHYSCGQCDECKNHGWIFHCRWATRSEQSKNRVIPARKLYTFDGKSLSLKEWSRELDIPQGTLNMRIRQYGWSVERAFSTPRRKYDGE